MEEVLSDLALKILHQSKKVILKPLKLAYNFLIIDLRIVMKNFAMHDGELSTCALAFFLLISFIPASLVIISILSFFYDSNAIADLFFQQIQNQLPQVNIDNLITILDRIIFNKRYLAFIWIPFLFWWGSFVFDIIERGLEKAFRIEESRRYWKAKIRHFILIIGMAIFVLSLTLISNFIAILRNSDLAQLLNDNLSNIPVINQLVTAIGDLPFLLTSMTTLLINTFLIFIIYRFVPPKKLNNRSIFKGALFASFSYEIVKSLFSYYITEINDYSSIFGSLNTIVILMIWIWYTCFLFVIGAELAWVFYEKSVRAHELSFDD